MARSRIVAAALCLVAVVGVTGWVARGGLARSPDVIEIHVPPTRFLEVVRAGNGDWEPFVEPGTGFTGYRLTRELNRMVTVRMSDMNDQRATSDEYVVAPGGYVVTGNQLLRIRPGPS